MKRKVSTMDLARLAQDLGLDKEECVEIVHLFVETTLSDLDTLERAVQSGDAALAVQSSHSIKGASANLGFGVISAIAEEVEMKARRSVLEGAREASDLIKDHIRSIQRALEP